MALPLLLYLYIRTNDAEISRLAPEAVALSLRRWTDKEVWRVASESAMLRPLPSLSTPEELDPKMGRRYIVIGECCMSLSLAVLLSFVRGLRDLCGVSRVHFSGTAGCSVVPVVLHIRVWPSSHSDSQPKPEVTVFHTAAIIQFDGRSPALQVYLDINVEGTKNIVAAVRKIGTSMLVYSSSGSISIRSNHFL